MIPEADHVAFLEAHHGLINEGHIYRVPRGWCRRPPTASGRTKYIQGSPPSTEDGQYMLTYSLRFIILSILLANGQKLWNGENTHIIISILLAKKNISIQASAQHRNDYNQPAQVSAQHNSHIPYMHFLSVLLANCCTKCRFYLLACR